MAQEIGPKSEALNSEAQAALVKGLAIAEEDPRRWKPGQVREDAKHILAWCLPSSHVPPVF